MSWRSEPGVQWAFDPTSSNPPNLLVLGFWELAVTILGRIVKYALAKPGMEFAIAVSSIEMVLKLAFPYAVL